MARDLLARVRTLSMLHNLLAPGMRVVVGVSGGADSLVLLHVLLQLRASLDLMLHVATLDHGLRGEAGAADAEFVRQTAEAWGVPVTVGRADVGAFATAQRLGIEAAARRVRYAFLEQVAQEVGSRRIAVGHHLDDQAETVLLHVLRGSGLQGLRGMLPSLPLSPQPPFPVDGERGSKTCDQDVGRSRAGSLRAPLTLIRPLLDVSRAEIEAYAAAHEIAYRVDATNQDPAFLRNRLRHEILPLLETVNPQVRQALARLADVVRVDADYVARAGAEALARVIRERYPEALILDRAQWGALEGAEKRIALKCALQQISDTALDVSYTHLTDAIQVADMGRVGAQAQLPAGWMLRVDYDTLVLQRSGAETADFGIDAPALERDAESLTLSGLPVTHTAGDWVLEAYRLGVDDDLVAIHADPLAAALTVSQGARMYLRRRVAGDRFRPRGMAGRSQKLSDTMITMRVPAVWRDRVPLLVVDDEIAWFVAPSEDGLRGRVAEPFAVQEGEIAPGALIVVVRWRRA